MGNTILTEISNQQIVSGIVDSGLIVVLYSPQIKLWKIADFGLTSETITTAPITTKYARGTGGYRAPELLTEYSKYTLKVDVWALGCIFYELLVKQKAFLDDWNVREFYHSSSPTLPVSIPLLPQILERHLSEFIHEMIIRDPQKRPSITMLYPLIQSYRTLLDVQTIEEIEYMPEYNQWKELISKSPQGDQGVLAALMDWYDSAGQMDAVVQLLKAVISKFPHLNDFKERLAESYAKMGNWDGSIEIWTSLIDGNPSEERLVDKLAAACQTRGDILWKELVDKHLKILHPAKHTADRKAGPQALFTAVVNGNVEVVELLLKAGADIEAKDDFGLTPISLAAWRGHTEVVKLLLKARADIEVKDDFGLTPISLAASRGHVEVAKLLLKAGVNIKTKNTFGLTPMSLAALYRRVEVVELLRTHSHP
jgi:tetratricopeptide (TPR) repeat protein